MADSAPPLFNYRSFLREVTTAPGIYQMYGALGELLYIGKAHHLRRRLSSYFGQRSQQTPRIAALVSQIARIEVITTHTESEALLLENNLIKEHHPRYNILLRDDKSYPYLHLTDHPFPRLMMSRSRQREGEGRSFGPYPSATAVRESLDFLHKLFPLRSCDETTYAHRSRPCLQYQIQRCSAPCVGLISSQDYAEEVRHLELFLQGERQEVLDRLVAQMSHAAAEQRYEAAALLRNRIAQLRQLQEQQQIIQGHAHLDVAALTGAAEHACVQLLYVRDGHLVGSRHFIWRDPLAAPPAEQLNSWVKRYYLEQLQRSEPLLPDRILLSEAIADQRELAQLLTQRQGRKVELLVPQRGELTHWMEMAQRNAAESLRLHLHQAAHLVEQFAALQPLFELPQPCERIECYDISHTQGEAAVASGVVFNRGGAVKRDYRRYHIEAITGGDDYAALEQVLQRRLRPFRDQPTEAEWQKLPQLLLIDGGRGQVGRVQQVVDQLGLTERLRVVGIAKGEGRKPRFDRLILPDREEPIILPAESATLHLLQRIRDEAHRFALEGHRQRRGQQRLTSPLEGIAGLGAKRRQRLLEQFGGLASVMRAGVADLMRVDGISQLLAERIYRTFHPSE